MDTAAAIAIALPQAVRLVKDGVRRDRANAYALLEPWTLPPLGGDLPEMGLMPPKPFADKRIRVEVETVGGSDGQTVGPSDRWTITVLPWQGLDGAECDGCTMAPDTWGDLKLYVAALFHDRWYLSMYAIAREWGWAEDKVRYLGDIVLASIIRSLAAGLPFWSRLRARAAAFLYYKACRAFGGIAHRVMQSSSGTVNDVNGMKTSLSVPADGSPSPSGSGGTPVHGTDSTLAGALFLSVLLSGCSGCAVPNAWDDTVGFYRIEEPAVAYTNAVTGAHWEVGQSDGRTVGRSDRETEEGAE